MTDILREIGMIARALDSISNIEFKELSLTRGQYLYLVRVCENPGIIQEKIAELIKVDRTTAARAIKRLEEQGFIYRQEDASNKKIKRIYATEKGKCQRRLGICQKREHSKLLRKGRLIDGRNKTINNRRCTSVTRNQH